MANFVVSTTATSGFRHCTRTAAQGYRHLTLTLLPRYGAATLTAAPTRFHIGHTLR